jgi:hypothetical protein
MLFAIAFLLLVFTRVKTKIGIKFYITEKREEFTKLHEAFKGSLKNPLSSFLFALSSFFFFALDELKVGQRSFILSQRVFMLW